MYILLMTFNKMLIKTNYSWKLNKCIFETQKYLNKYENKVNIRFVNRLTSTSNTQTTANIGR